MASINSTIQIEFSDKDRRLLEAFVKSAESTCSGSWMDFESAPKDGSSILAFCSHGIYVISWIEHDIEFWHVDDNKHGPFPLRGAMPTHWMPLPASPVS